jgi:N-acetylglucosaminyldiphosphoundecaprenol N-acetyl-beta-D-mannosaminyltransferase
MTDIKILGVKINNLNNSELLANIKACLAGDQPHQIATVNPEFLLEARRNDEFLSLLNKLDLRLADGFGLQCSALVKGRLLARHTGADLVIDLLNLANTNDLTIAVINRRDGLSSASDISQALTKSWPSLKFKILEPDLDQVLNSDNELNELSADIIFCALGSPAQEQLLFTILPKSSAKIGIGVGGSFDYLTGRAKRAPRLMQSLGLEWLWRLMINPRLRIKRIFNAVIKFPFYFILDDLIHPWFYRPNVVAFIYQGDEILIINSAKEEGEFWKLPQGGIEAHENAEQAVRREMTEELQLDNFSISAIYYNIYRYDWPDGYTIRGYRGQRLNLCLINYQGAKDAIQLNWENRDYKWVKIDNLLDAVDPIVRPATELFLKKYKEFIK